MRNNTPRTVAISLVIQLFALVVLLVFRSDSFLGYTYDLPPSSFSSKIVEFAQYWDDQMSSIGVADVRNRVIEFVEMLHGEEEF